MNDKLPIAVMPLHDPDGTMFPLLEAVQEDLERLFSTTLLGLTAGTSMSQPEYAQRFRDGSFFRMQVHGQTMPVGAEFRALYTLAAASFAPEQILHLCFPDRVAFALSSEHRTTFLGDVAAIQESEAPVIFQRSESAWQSHPANYRQLEGMITTVGEMLFGRSLDFAWCQLVITASQLARVLPRTSRRDISFMAELVVHLRDQIQTKDVDWLAWEDPFIYDRDALEMKAELEADPAETRKRLSYVLPMLDVLAQAAAQ